MFRGSVDGACSAFPSPAAFIKDIIQRGRGGEKGLSVGVTRCHALLENGGHLEATNGPLLGVIINNGPLQEIKLILAKKEVGVNDADSATGVTPLMVSCVLGRDEVMKWLIKQGADPNLSDGGEMNSFHYSIWGMNIKCVKALLTIPLINSKDQYGRSALMIAAHKGSIPIFQLLVKKGASLLDKDNGNRTIIHWAVTSGNVSLLEMISKRYIPGINHWSSTDDEGATPLHYALIGGGRDNVQILQFLLKKGCDPTVPDITNGLSVIHWSCVLGSLDHLHCILSDTPNNDELVLLESSLGRPLHLAAIVGAVDISQLLIERNDSVVNSSDSSGLTPLHCSSTHGHIDTVKLLLANNANINGVNDTNGRSCLHYASPGGHLEVVRELLKNGAERDRPSHSTDRPIHLAASKGRKEIMDLLISNGSSVDIVRASDGRTPLHISSAAGQLVCVRYLLDKGADYNRRDTTGGFTPLDLALLNDHSTVGECLIALGASTGSGRIHESATLIQQYWRRYVHKRRECVTRDWAARRIQCQYHCWSDRRKARRLRKIRERRRNEAAHIIQRNWLGYINMKRKMEESVMALRTKLKYEYMGTQLILSELEHQSKRIQLPSTHSQYPTAKHLLKLTTPSTPSVDSRETHRPSVKPLHHVRMASEEYNDIDRAETLYTAPSGLQSTKTHSHDSDSITRTQSQTLKSNREGVHNVSLVPSLEKSRSKRKSSNISKSASSPVFPLVKNPSSQHQSANDKLYSSPSFDSEKLPSLTQKPLPSSSSGTVHQRQGDETSLPLLPAGRGGGDTALRKLRHEPVSTGKREAKINNESSLPLLTGGGSNAKKTSPRTQKGLRKVSQKSEKLMSPEGESLLLNHAERYNKLHHVMELLQEAKEAQKSSCSGGIKADYREIKVQIQSALEEAVRLRAETETLSGKLIKKE